MSSKINRNDREIQYDCDVEGCPAQVTVRGRTADAALDALEMVGWTIRDPMKPTTCTKHDSTDV